MIKTIKASASIFTFKERTVNYKLSKDALYDLGKNLGNIITKQFKSIITHQVKENAVNNNVHSNVAEVESTIELVVMTKEDYETLVNSYENRKLDYMTKGLLIADVTRDEMIVHESYILTENGFELVKRDIENGIS